MSWTESVAVLVAFDDSNGGRSKISDVFLDTAGVQFGVGTSAVVPGSN